jgi:tetratricopeptide (TPR) repeat protein
MKILRNAFILFFTVILILITGCNKSENNDASGNKDSINKITSVTQVQGIDTGSTTYTGLRYGDSTDIYGTGNFDYHDSLETYHRGYSIPRDSIYKVKNIKAFEELNYFIRKYPTRPGPYLDRGNHFQNIKMYREAIEDYDKYIQLYPYNHSAYMNRGNAYERLKIYDSAMADYNKTLELKPNDTIANFNKGNIHDIRGEFELAVKEYDTVIIKDRRLAKAYYNRGTSYANLRNFPLAIRDWEEAIKLNPTYEVDLKPRIDRVRRLIK